MTIAFIHEQKAFMPEIAAYVQFFSASGIQCLVVKPGETLLQPVDVEWYFMGLDRSKRQEGKVSIHEYTSASVPPYRKLKDLIKKWGNTKPDFRIFLNSYVKGQLNFNDDVPFGLRDMGVHTDKVLRVSTDKKYDFIYSGSTDPVRKMAQLLHQFSKPGLRDRSLLVLSRNYQSLANDFRHQKNIEFTGPVAHDEVKEYLQQSRFAINFIPDIPPFNKQTSTKLLEYAACNIPVITTNYEWVQKFSEQTGARFFLLEKDMSNFKWENINRFDYRIPDLSDWSWEKQIRRSGVSAFLQSKFPFLLFS